MVPYASDLIALPPNAPSRILVDRLLAVGIGFADHGLVHDAFGPFQLLTGNFPEIKMRLQWAWTKVVAEELKHRRDFKGLDMADLLTTRKQLAKHSADGQGLLRLGLTGGAFAGDCQSKWDASKLACQWCGEPDSLAHRYWTCSGTVSLRSKHAVDATMLHASLPPVLALRGWAVFPPDRQHLVQMIANIPHTVMKQQCAFRGDVINHVFTDGSCLEQDNAQLRLASWGAVVAMPLTPDWAFEHHGILGAGVLPGLIQHAFRAELYALAFVLHCAAHREVAVHIYTDNQGVIDRFYHLVFGHGRLGSNSSHCDLWNWVLQSVG